MLANLLFSFAGTLIFALLAAGLVWLMALLGGGQRVRPAEGRAAAPDGSSQRPGRPATRRARR
ncbi:MAG: hypothetical protein HY710_02255 [Candidatus Latescibacteria bacterium]|nr:hypothetical protein [Candidatus Latescibacterota bacterium]